MSEIEIRSLNGHKLVDETAREMIANGVGNSVQSDWDVNDENDLAYIKNRTHYSEFNEKEIFNQEIVIDSYGLYESVISGETFGLENVKSVTVTYDNTQYICPVYKFYYIYSENTYAFGNSVLLNEIGKNADIQFPTGNTDMPFIMMIVEDQGIIIISVMGTEEGTHSIKINGIEETVFKIDEKYLPPLIGKKGSGYCNEIFNDYTDHKVGADGQYNHIEGRQNNITGLGNHVEGFANIAVGQYGHTEGSYGLVSSENGHIEGDGYFQGGNCTLTFLEDSKIEFKTSYKTLDMLNYPEHYCFVIYDDNNNACYIDPNTIIEYSQSDEGLTYIYQYYYDAFPTDFVGKTFKAIIRVHIADGNGVHVEGLCNIGRSTAQHVQGKYNLPNHSQYAHIVGNGTDCDARSNAHTLDWEGNAWYSGDVYVGSTSGTNKDEGSKKLATEDFVSNAISAIPTPDVSGQIAEAMNELRQEILGGEW